MAKCKRIKGEKLFFEVKNNKEQLAVSKGKMGGRGQAWRLGAGVKHRLDVKRKEQRIMRKGRRGGGCQTPLYSARCQSSAYYEVSGREVSDK
ncbi:MAG: hypothetical protein LBL06_00585 [Treponema sp.]|jgi:hypothetical protein|nr:hypothetical protein [Treponema sp.]